MSRATDYYDQYWRSEDFQTRPPLTLLELFERYVSTSDQCIDVGCGDGGTSGVWLADHAGGYVGVDISETALEMATRRGLSVRRIADASRLPFADHCFDVAVLVEVLEHLFEPQLALLETKRVLRQGARLIVTVPNVAHWRNRLDLALFGRWNPRGDHLSATQPWRDAHLRFFTLRSLTNLLTSCGFEVIARGGYVEHGFAEYVPGLRRVTRSSSASPMARKVAETHPRLFGGNLYTVGKASGPLPGSSGADSTSGLCDQEHRDG